MHLTILSILYNTWQYDAHRRWWESCIEAITSDWLAFCLGQMEGRGGLESSNISLALDFKGIFFDDLTQFSCFTKVCLLKKYCYSEAWPEEQYLLCHWHFFAYSSILINQINVWFHKKLKAFINTTIFKCQSPASQHISSPQDFFSKHLIIKLPSLG